MIVPVTFERTIVEIWVCPTIPPTYRPEALIVPENVQSKHTNRLDLLVIPPVELDAPVAVDVTVPLYETDCKNRLVPESPKSPPTL